MKPNSWSLRLGREDNLPLGIWSFHKPRKTECASFCGKKDLNAKTRVPEMRGTGFDGTAQVWYYCPECWARLVGLRRKRPTVNVRCVLGSILKDYAWEKRP